MAVEIKDLFQPYRVTLEFRDKIMGGVPKDPKIIEGWLRTKSFVSSDEEIKFQMQKTLEELGAVLPPEGATVADLVQASEAMSLNKQTNGFKRDEDGLYLEGRAVKAMLKEVTNILFASERWGPTKKGPKSYLAERLFVQEDRIHLGRMEPDGVETFMGHVSGPKGPQSTLTYYEYCYKPVITFTVLSTDDCIGQKEKGKGIGKENWVRILWHAQENGLGALRSQQHGRFDVTGIETVTPDAPQDWIAKFMSS